MINAIQQTVTTITVIGPDPNVAPYVATNVEYAGRYSSAVPALPVGITGRTYEQGVRNALKKGDDIVDGGPRIWPPGDDIIFAVFGVSPPPPPPPPPDDVIAVFKASSEYRTLLSRISVTDPAIIKNYVSNNISNLTDAKILLAQILVMLGAIARD